MDKEIIQFPVPEEEKESMSLEAFRKIQEAIPGLEGLESILLLLELPDEDFNALAPIMLEELEKGFNNSNDKYSIALAFNESGLSAAELNKVLNETIESVDSVFADYSDQKRDFVKQIFHMLVNSMETAKALRHRIIRIPIELCHENAKIPTYANDGDAGCDVYALADYTLEPHTTTIIPTGLKVAIPHGYEIQVRPRSGMSAKTKVRVANSPGTIDSGYRNEIGIIFDNIGDHPFYIVKGQRIAQLVLNEIPTASFYQVSNISEIEGDRKGGFGSTGK